MAEINGELKTPLSTTLAQATSFSNAFTLSAILMRYNLLAPLRTPPLLIFHPNPAQIEENCFGKVNNYFLKTAAGFFTIISVIAPDAKLIDNSNIFRPTSIAKTYFNQSFPDRWHGEGRVAADRMSPLSVFKFKRLTSSRGCFPISR